MESFASGENLDKPVNQNTQPHLNIDKLPQKIYNRAVPMSSKKFLSSSDQICQGMSDNEKPYDKLPSDHVIKSKNKSDISDLFLLENVRESKYYVVSKEDYERLGGLSSTNSSDNSDSDLTDESFVIDYGALPKMSRFISPGNVNANYLDQRTLLHSAYASEINARSNVSFPSQLNPGFDPVNRNLYPEYNQFNLGAHSEQLNPGAHSEQLNPGAHSEQLNPGAHSEHLDYRYDPDHQLNPQVIPWARTQYLSSDFRDEFSRHNEYYYEQEDIDDEVGSNTVTGKFESYESNMINRPVYKRMYREQDDIDTEVQSPQNTLNYDFSVRNSSPLPQSKEVNYDNKQIKRARYDEGQLNRQEIAINLSYDNDSPDQIQDSEVGFNQGQGNLMPIVNDNPTLCGTPVYSYLLNSVNYNDNDRTSYTHTADITCGSSEDINTSIIGSNIVETSPNKMEVIESNAVLQARAEEFACSVKPDYKGISREKSEDYNIDTEGLYLTSDTIDLYKSKPVEYSQYCTTSDLVLEDPNLRSVAGEIYHGYDDVLSAEDLPAPTTNIDPYLPHDLASHESHVQYAADLAAQHFRKNKSSRSFINAFEGKDLRNENVAINPKDGTVIIVIPKGVTNSNDNLRGKDSDEGFNEDISRGESLDSLKTPTVNRTSDMRRNETDEVEFPRPDEDANPSLEISELANEIDILKPDEEANASFGETADSIANKDDSDTIPGRVNDVSVISMNSVQLKNMEANIIETDSIEGVRRGSSEEKSLDNTVLPANDIVTKDTTSDVFSSPTNFELLPSEGKKEQNHVEQSFKENGLNDKTSYDNNEMPSQISELITAEVSDGVQSSKDDTNDQLGDELNSKTDVKEVVEFDDVNGYPDENSLKINFKEDEELKDKSTSLDNDISSQDTGRNSYIRGSSEEKSMDNPILSADEIGNKDTTTDVFSSPTNFDSLLSEGKKEQNHVEQSFKGNGLNDETSYDNDEMPSQISEVVITAEVSDGVQSSKDDTNDQIHDELKSKTDVKEVLEFDNVNGYPDEISPERNFYEDEKLMDNFTSLDNDISSQDTGKSSYTMSEESDIDDALRELDCVIDSAEEEIEENIENGNFQGKVTQDKVPQDIVKSKKKRVKRKKKNSVNDEKPVPTDSFNENHDQSLNLLHDSSLLPLESSLKFTPKGRVKKRKGKPIAYAISRNTTINGTDKIEKNEKSSELDSVDYSIMMSSRNSDSHSGSPSPHASGIYDSLNMSDTSDYSRATEPVTFSELDLLESSSDEMMNKKSYAQAVKSATYGDLPGAVEKFGHVSLASTTKRRSKRSTNDTTRIRSSSIDNSASILDRKNREATPRSDRISPGGSIKKNGDPSQAVTPTTRFDVESRYTALADLGDTGEGKRLSGQKARKRKGRKSPPLNEELKAEKHVKGSKNVKDRNRNNDDNDFDDISKKDDGFKKKESASEAILSKDENDLTSVTKSLSSNKTNKTASPICCYILLAIIIVVLAIIIFSYRNMKGNGNDSFNNQV